MSDVVFGRLAASIGVTDMVGALALYEGVLGMTKTFENGSPVRFVILKRGEAELHLTLVATHSPAPHNVAHLLVDEATALHDHLVANGVPIVKALRDGDAGLRQFVFSDPDGNRIDVAQRR